MAVKLYTNAELIAALERSLSRDRIGFKIAADDLDPLKQLAKDLRARTGGRPGATLVEFQRRLADIVSLRAKGKDETGAWKGLGQYVAGAWPVVRQALERFGAEIEHGQGEEPTDAHLHREGDAAGGLGG